MSAHGLTIDLITERPADGAFVLILIEEGPWDPDQIESHLQRIQDRLYDCIDAAIDGHLAAKYPKSTGKPVIIRLDCYDTPDETIANFMRRFAESISGSHDVQRDLAVGRFVKSLSVEHNWRPLPAT